MNADEEYLLGAMTDAYFDTKRSEIQFYQKNREWLEHINDLLFRCFNVKGKIFKRDVFLLRKRNKEMALKIKSIQKKKIHDGTSFVSGLFDAEGSIYLSTKSKIPVLDITQSEKGLKNLLIAKEVFEREKIKCFLNGPYKNKHGKLLQYHLRVYGKGNCKLFLLKVGLKHPEKLKKLMFLADIDPTL